MENTQTGSDLFSINPFLPCNEYVPDGEPRIFGDRVYIYGSHDLIDSRDYCKGDYVCWSASCADLAHWKYEGVIYQKKQDPYVKQILSNGKGNMMNSHLFAPDVIEMDGKYYMYYGVGLSKSGIGVAVSDSPTGPFEYIGRVRYPESEKPKNWKDGKDGIDDGDLAFGYGKSPFTSLGHYPYDPGVIYDNGRLFLYYGLYYCRMVELDAKDKRTVIRNQDTGKFESELLVPGTLNPFGRGILKASDGMGMVNAPSIRKIDNTYYLVYYASDAKNCHAMCYATAESPFGPFRYGGILVSLGNARRNGNKEIPYYTGNVHGGIVCINGIWYGIYHRHTGLGMCGRQACVAVLHRNPDGSFDHAEHNSQGFSAAPLPAYYRWPAYMACHLTDRKGRAKANAQAPVITQMEYKGGMRDLDSGKEVFQVVSNTTDGSVAGYKHFDFGARDGDKMEITLRLRPLSSGYIEVYADDPKSGVCLGRVDVPKASDDWQEVHSQIRQLTGVHSIYFVFHSDGKPLCDLSHFTFR